MNDLTDYSGCDGLLNINIVEVRHQIVSHIIQLNNNGFNDWAKVWDRLCEAIHKQNSHQL